MCLFFFRRPAISFFKSNIEVLLVALSQAAFQWFSDGYFRLSVCQLWVLATFARCFSQCSLSLLCLAPLSPLPPPHLSQPALCLVLTEGTHFFWKALIVSVWSWRTAEPNKFLSSLMVRNMYLFTTYFKPRISLLQALWDPGELNFLPKLQISDFLWWPSNLFTLSLIEYMIKMLPDVRWQTLFNLNLTAPHRLLADPPRCLHFVL